VIAEQPVHAMGCAVSAGLDAAVVCVCGLKDVQRLGRVGEEGGDLAQYRRAGGLDGEEALGAAVEHRLRRLSLGVDRAAGDQRAVRRQRRQQRALR
jgi:hypothetical protein